MADLYAALISPVYAITLASAAFALVSVAQGKILFGHSWRIKRASIGPADDRRKTESVWLNRPDGTELQGWLTLPVGVAPTRLLLWFGGRNEHVAWTPDMAGWIPDDCALLSFNYRSLGRSSGWPSEASSVMDGQAMVEWGKVRLGIGSDSVYLAGRSLGSGVAMQIASRMAAKDESPAGVVLISPLKSLRAVLKINPLLIPFLPFLRSPFDSSAAAQNLSCDVLLILAERDRQVPLGHSLSLAETLKASGCEVSVHKIPRTNHCTLARAPQAMKQMGDWLASTSPIPPPLLLPAVLERATRVSIPACTVTPVGLAGR